MTFYQGMAGTASRMLAKFGQAAMLYRPVVGDYDPAMGKAASGAVILHGHAFDYDYSQRDIDGTLIRQGDRRVLLSVEVGTQPETGDKVVIREKWWDVVGVKTIGPEGNAVVYELQVRA